MWVWSSISSSSGICIEGCGKPLQTWWLCLDSRNPSFETKQTCNGEFVMNLS